MRQPSRSAFHIRTASGHAADAADLWFARRGFQIMTAVDVYDACSQLIKAEMPVPAIVLIGSDGLDGDDFVIVDYIRKLYPDSMVIGYGSARPGCAARNVRGVSVAADWQHLECLLNAWEASRERLTPTQRDPIFDEFRAGTITALREFQAATPTRSAAVEPNGSGRANGVDVHGSHHEVARRIGFGPIDGTAAPVRAGGDSAPRVQQAATTHRSPAASRNPIRAVLTLAERAALLGLEPAPA